MQLSITSSSVLATLLLLPFTISATSPVKSLRYCKCQPHLPCWPSTSQWQQLNTTVGGMLISNIRPVASACYEGTPEYDQVRCDEVTRLFGDSAWRADQAGDVQHPVWESYSFLEENCYLPSLLPNKTELPQCQQGSVPQYAVRARCAKDISAAVKFAAKNSIPVVIKNTGHDYLGRASRRNALMIWTHFMKDIAWENEKGNWSPAGCRGSAGKKYREKDLLVKAAAGVYVYELYREVGKRNRTVVAGAASTVGVAGGFIQGGGHSPLGVWKGLASDHAVEFEVVLADGSVVKASPCANPDLFWALRGGGGGTFGIVTSVTLRTHKNVAMPILRLNVTIPITGDGSSASKTMWDLVDLWHSIALRINELGGSGYYFMYPNTPLPDFNISANLFVAILFFADQPDATKIEKLFKPFNDWLYTNVGGPETGLVMQEILPSLLATDYLNNFPPSQDGQGKFGILGSRLISRELLSTPEGVGQLTNALKTLSGLGSKTLLGHFVAPPPDVQVDSAAHPAWRKAITHIVVPLEWNAGDSFEYQEEVKMNMTDVMVPLLKELDLDPNTGRQTMGAYVNEADKEEPDWQDSFWGSKYGRLRLIKDKYDPNGVFWCRPCVGSEVWDFEGICKKHN